MKNVNKEDVEFEIAFYNGLIEKNPKFAEALIALGELYTTVGMYKEGLAVDEQLAQLKPDDPIVHYNLACSYSLMNEVDKALRSIKKAIHCGYCDYGHMESDSDLDNLRADKRFLKFLSKAKARDGQCE